MKLTNPIPYRLWEPQDEWLQARSVKKGHHNKAIALREAVDIAIRVTSPKRANGKKRAA